MDAIKKSSMWVFQSSKPLSTLQTVKLWKHSKILELSERDRLNRSQQMAGWSAERGSGLASSEVLLAKIYIGMALRSVPVKVFCYTCFRECCRNLAGTTPYSKFQWSPRRKHPREVFYYKSLPEALSSSRASCQTRSRQSRFLKFLKLLNVLEFLKSWIVVLLRTSSMCNGFQMIYSFEN